MSEFTLEAMVWEDVDININPSIEKPDISKAKAATATILCHQPSDCYYCFYFLDSLEIHNEFEPIKKDSYWVESIQKALKDLNIHNESDYKAYISKPNPNWVDRAFTLVINYYGNPFDDNPLTKRIVSFISPNGSFGPQGHLVNELDSLSSKYIHFCREYDGKAWWIKFLEESEDDIPKEDQQKA